MNTNPIDEKEVGDVVHEEHYQASTLANSHVVQPKSPSEKRLLLKADFLILPLAAFGYFAAYMVHIHTPV
jgi:hypothetical protein